MGHLSSPDNDENVELKINNPSYIRQRTEVRESLPPEVQRQVGTEKHRQESRRPRAETPRESGLEKEKLSSNGSRLSADSLES